MWNGLTSGFLLLTYTLYDDNIMRMWNKKIFNNYIITKNGKPIQSDYYTVHERNLEGSEMQFLKFMPPDKNIKILDVGCGCGQLLYMLKEKGYVNIEGVDLGYQQVEITKNLGIKAEKISDLSEYLNAHKETWDMILMSQVIEHFSKDKMMLYLSAVKDALKSKGKAIISVPNMALASGLIQRYTDFTHEFGFTERSLHQVLRVAGFPDIQIYGEKLSFKPRLKFLVWLLLRNIWFKILGFIYLLEKGIDRPKIISRHLIAVVKK